MTTTNITGTQVHIFQSAGLGVGPFRLSHVTGEGGSCEYCGTTIVWRFYLNGSDGKQFFVGSDCVLKSGDAGLIKVVEAEVKRRQNDARKVRETAKLSALTAMLQSPDVSSKLSAMPHPTKYYATLGRTMMDYAQWMLKHSGTAGKLKLAKTIQKIMQT